MQICGADGEEYTIVRQNDILAIVEETRQALSRINMIDTGSR